MTVKEVVTLAAEELRITTEVAEYFDGESTIGQAKADLLLTCYNLVENELALDYFTLVKEETVASTGAVLFSSLKNAPVRILGVTDIYGQDLEYKLYPNYMTVQKGGVKIRYVYTPNEKTINDDCEFMEKVSARLMSFGMAAEYCMAMGAFEESALWDKKYKDAILAIQGSSKGGRMASRRWA